MRPGTQCAGGDAFFNTGDAEPFCSCADDGRRAERKRVTVGVGFDDGEQFGVRRGESGKKAEVLFESASANLGPAWTHWHGGLQRTVYRAAHDEGFLRQQRKGHDGFEIRAGLPEQFCFEIVRDSHLAGGDLLGRSADKAQLAMAQTLGIIVVHCAHRRTEDAAGHGPPRVHIAATGGWIECGARRIVREILKSFLVLVGSSEQSRFRIAGKIRAVFSEPVVSAPFDFRSECRICSAQVSHSRAKARGVEHIDCECAVAALRASNAAGEKLTGAPRGIGKRGVHDLNKLGIARKKVHDVEDTARA